jgi:hypothetical protein
MEATKNQGHRTKLRHDWYLHVKDAEIDLALSGVYEWRITGAGLYVGKAKVLRTRILAYPNNIRRMLEGQPWHGDPSKDYRPIHHELRKAYDDGRSVSVVVLETCDPSRRAERERWWIRKRQAEAFAGGPPVLNSN